MHPDEKAAPQPPLSVGDLVVDVSKGTVTAAGKPLGATATEAALLFHLGRRAGHIVRKEELFAACWDEAADETSSVVELRLAQLRQKLRKAGSTAEIRSLRLGYLLESVEAGEAE
jgi:DNA-binding response OmpR family regulator